jgi:isoleucyl-tRNA synthetase
MSRIPDVLDTWFDSGSMPYGERHYPFENKEKFDAVFPAQFIAEGLDQTRAWFYYLHVLAGGLFQKSAFQNVIVNGIVLAEDGKKMSKKLKNYPDPMEVVDKYGADAMRYYLLSSPVMQAENLGFSEKGVDEVVKKNIGRLQNVLAFYELYADGTVRDWKSTNVLDRWILSRLEELVLESTTGFESYQLDVATRPIAGFIDDLSVWYLRRSRDRFKEEGADKTAALATMRYVLHTLARVMAPSMPFFAEHLFQAIREEEDEESVHLAMWPEAGVEAQFEISIIDAMSEARNIVTLALEKRDAAGIKVRQPLGMTHIPPVGFATIPEVQAFLSIIAEEINVKTVQILSSLTVGTVALDITITPELREEGFVRDLVRAVQGARKDAGLNPHDTIALSIATSQDAAAIILKYQNELKQTLKAQSIQFANAPGLVQKLGDYEVGIAIAKV